jgi:hypothetical protein
LEFVLRKPLGRLAIAVLASIAIPLALAPVALASAPALTTSSNVNSFKDNDATGIDLPDGFGILRIASTTGLPSNIISKHFDVVEKAFQAEEDGRYWDVKVKLKEGHSFKRGDVTVSWHCPGHGQKPPTKTTSPTSPTTSSKHHSTTPTTPSKPTESTPATSAQPTKASESPVTTTPSVPAPGSGDVVEAPVRPAPSGGTAPVAKAQIPFTPVGGVETGFGYLAS